MRHPHGCGPIVGVQFSAPALRPTRLADNVRMTDSTAHTPGSTAAGSIDRDRLALEFDRLLEPARFRDYGPNGLQVEGRPIVRRIVSGVTASRALIEAAIEADADAIFVHHGLFWRGQDGRVTGWLRQRLALLLRQEINLYAYHLPLDAHSDLGNNAQLARQLGWTITGRFGEQDLGCIGRWTTAAQPWRAQDLAQHLERTLARRVTAVLSHDEPIERVAWCTGGAQAYFEAAISAGAQVFVTGEISEPQAHLARETGVAYLACGHHATERYGAPAVAAAVAALHGLEHRFIDIDNPA